MVSEQVVDIEHGTLSAYTKHGCRCDPCREFWNAYMRWWRARKQGRLHGTCPTCTCPTPDRPRPTAHGTTEPEGDESNE